MTARHWPAQRAPFSGHRNLDAVVGTGLGRAEHPGLWPCLAPNRLENGLK
jgi:hypothetical protein